MIQLFIDIRVVRVNVIRGLSGSKPVGRPGSSDEKKRKKEEKGKKREKKGETGEKGEEKVLCLGSYFLFLKKG